MRGVNKKDYEVWGGRLLDDDPFLLLFRSYRGLLPAAGTRDVLR